MEAVGTDSQVPAGATKACREKAMTDFHYRTMAAGYAGEYEQEIAQSAGAGK